MQASVRSGGKAIPIAQLEEDERFRSVFITSDPTLKTLAGAHEALERFDLAGKPSRA